ncbi:MAG TPA: DEAD/DEAH box helicase family protein [Solirubrobacteraceae bacterium]|jgi:ribonuclease E|nr:DEAD/DEAH box helicase family protein [Solirubrobacteraceae bacterium]
MAESTQVALAVASIPSSADIARAEEFVRERFLHDGEDPTVALARAGGSATVRRRALDAALAELKEHARYPSTAWRREYALLLGLERLLSDQEPKLHDGTVLSAHQVDALSGTLTALLAEAERSGNGGNGRVASAASPELLASAAILGNGRPAGGTPAADGAVSTHAAAQSGAEDEQEQRLEAEEADARVEDDEEEVEEGDDEEEELGDLEDELEPLPEGEAEEDEQEEGDEEPRDWVEEDEEEQLSDQPEDPNAAKRFWFEHATGAGKTVAALGFVEASQTGGILILTHRRNLVDQFLGELRARGYSRRISRPLYKGEDSTQGPVSVETYQWFVRNAGRISSAYTIVICDEAHTALGEKTSGAIRAWTGPIFIGMTATGALIARHVTDLFPTQTSRFDLAQAARRGVISPLRCVRIPPGVGVRTIAKVPLRRGEVDVEFDQEELAQLLDQQPFNLAMANLYRTRFNGVPGVVYAAGVQHAYNLAVAFRAEGIKAQAVSGETPKRELASILARYERGDIDVLINAQLLAEGWNSPRATVCVHLAPTASKRIYQQRVGRVTRRNPGKEAGLVVDFVHPATKHDDPVVTLHSLLDRDVYRGGAIVVGPVRRGRGRRIRVERRVLPVCAEEDRRIQVLERELWRIAVENLEYGEQHGWAALAGARVTAPGWRRARAMLHFDRTGELKSSFLVSAVKRNPNPQLGLRALADIAAGRDPEAFDTAVEQIGTWGREERREGSKIMLRAMVERRIGRRDQAAAWIWRLAEYTRDLHEEYAVQRWPETKRLLGLLVNSSGGAHARNARRLIHASRKQDRRLAAALLAAALAHTPEAEEALRGARTRMARKPPALARELLRNFPKRRARSNKRKRRGPRGGAGEGAMTVPIPTDASIPANSEAANSEAASGAAPARRKAKPRAPKPARSAEEAVEAAAARVIAASAAPVEGAQQKQGEEQAAEEQRAAVKKRAGRAKAAAGKTAAAKTTTAKVAGKPTIGKTTIAKTTAGKTASGKATAGKAGAGKTPGTKAKAKAAKSKAVAVETPEV